MRTRTSLRALALLPSSVLAFMAAPATRDQALTVVCTAGYDAVATACGAAPAAHYVPLQCTAWCQMMYQPWWLKCATVREFATLETSTNHALSGFYATCQAASTPTCSPCSGTATASDILPLDARVGTAGSPQQVAFKVAWRGQIANLLCVSSSQVAVTAITPPGLRLPYDVSGGGHRLRLLSEVGATVSLQVTWTVSAGTGAQAQSLVFAGQQVMGLPAAMGRRMQAPTTQACVVGHNVGPLVQKAKAVVPCVDKPMGSGIAGMSCAAAIGRLTAGCADAMMGATISKNCPLSCNKCISGVAGLATVQSSDATCQSLVRGASIDHAHGYSNNENCAWSVTCPYGKNVRLSFSTFATESNEDYVRVYASSAKSTLLATDSGSSTFTPVSSGTSKMYLTFTTDGSDTLAGFAANLTCAQSTGSGAGSGQR